MRRVVSQQGKKRQVQGKVSQRNRYRIGGEKQGVDSRDKANHIERNNQLFV